jgi:hypothetical protein
MSKKEIMKRFKQFMGNFKLLDESGLKELRNYAQAVGVKVVVREKHYCTDEKKIYNIIKIA